MSVKLGGVSEVAEHLGVSRQRIAQLRERADFPDPYAELAIGPVWDLDEIEAWMSSGVRRRPGRPVVGKTAARVLGERFVLEEPPIAAGGFGEVFRAQDRKTAEIVAVKVLKNVSDVGDEVVKRFRRELRIMSEELDSPHVMPIIDQGDFHDVDSIWCAMPLAVGSLQAEIGQMAGNTEMVVDLARQLCEGLSYVHDAGVLHRDLKPGNVLKTTDGLWAISDFGLAREFERVSEALTSTLQNGMGTIVYASPEQWGNPKTADVRDDIYSLGKILQHAITGLLPIAGADTIGENPLRPVIQRATGAKNGRYTSVDGLLAAIEQATASYDTKWENPQEREARLKPRVGNPMVDTVALSELIDWMQEENLPHEEDNLRFKLLTRLSKKDLEHAWSTNAAGVRKALVAYHGWVRSSGLAFDFCDDVANFIARAIEVTQDHDILRTGIEALAHMGCSHNRWHVRDVATEILQKINSSERAVAALEGLQAASADDVEWTITDFAARSMHPVLRKGIAAIIEGDSAA